MINKFYRLLGRTFGKPIDLKANREGVITLCPQEEQDVKLPIYLPGHLDRITGVTTNYLLRSPIERMLDPHLIHAPTLLLPLGKTRLFGGGLWTSKREFVTRSINENDHFAPIHLAKAVVTDFDHALEHFGHWLRDALPSSLIGSEDMPSLSLRRPEFYHATQYEKLLKIKTIYANRGTVENLYLLSDHSQNSYKLERYLTLRENLQQSLKPEKISFKGVYIARGKTGTNRTLLNGSELVSHLETKGFDIIYQESLSPEQIVKRVWGADLVITVEGSAHNHAIYAMARTGALLTLQPPARFGIIIKDACNCLGITWGFYVCQPGKNDESFYIDSFTDLDRLIDMLGNASAG